MWSVGYDNLRTKSTVRNSYERTEFINNRRRTCTGAPNETAHRYVAGLFYIREIAVARAVYVLRNPNTDEPFVGLSKRENHARACMCIGMEGEGKSEKSIKASS